MLSSDIVKYLKSSPEWNALADHIRSEINSLSLIKDIDFLDKEKASIEGRSRQLAREKLEKILEPFYMQNQEPIDIAKVTRLKTGLE